VRVLINGTARLSRRDAFGRSQTIVELGDGQVLGDAGTASRVRAFAAICSGFSIRAGIGALAICAMGNAATLLPSVYVIAILSIINVAARFAS
jgi:hypothetical protein